MKKFMIATILGALVMASASASRAENLSLPTLDTSAANIAKMHGLTKGTHMYNKTTGEIVPTPPAMVPKAVGTHKASPAAKKFDARTTKAVDVKTTKKIVETKDTKKK